MTENLLQFIWRHRLYSSKQALITTDGESLTVLNTGYLNTHAGTDFLEAKVKIGATVWAGNIEIHIKSSDWNKHKHEENEGYGKIILHVVYQDDATVKTYANSSFPTLELAPYLNPELWAKFEQLMLNKQFIPCENNLLQVRPITIYTQLQRMLAERLSEKTNHLLNLLNTYQNDWQEVFYIQLARGFGLHINQDAFEQLALQTPLKLFARFKHNPIQIESLLFGQAGFLDDYFDESYPLLLQQEYMHLKKLYSLQPVSKNNWKFLRLRPANFPTIRIAQFAQLIAHSSSLFSKIKSAATLKEIEKLLEVKLASYWLTHFTFQETSEVRNKSLGRSFIHSLIINAVIPVLYIYGKMQAQPEYCDRAIHFLQQLPAEKNALIIKWQALYPSFENAADTQAALQLYHKYCTTKKCLECSIGYELLKQ